MCVCVCVMIMGKFGQKFGEAIASERSDFVENASV